MHKTCCIREERLLDVGFIYGVMWLVIFFTPTLTIIYITNTHCMFSLLTLYMDMYKVISVISHCQARFLVQMDGYDRF